MDVNKPAFGQNQIIAKTLLTMSGIYISLTIVMKNIPLLQMSFNQDFGVLIIGIFSIIILISMLFAIVYFLVLNNNWLVEKILPNEEPIGPENQKLWLTTSLRAGLVFLGFILLAKETESIIFTVKFIFTLPMLGRQLISNILQGNKIFTDKFLFRHICNVFATAVIVYLIAGANGIVKYELKKKNLERLPMESSTTFNIEH